MRIKNLLGHKNLSFLAAAATLVLTYLSLGNISAPMMTVSNSDKIAHSIAYFVFTWIWFVFFYFSEKFQLSFVKSLLYASVLCFVYGVLMEVSQGVFTTYRYVELFDIVANTSGIVIAVIFIRILKNTLVRI
ncbi:VanZ family protein [Aquimarina intermedia]|uniref:VanZ family protein n=1 Tax=Aquimarina intermedia TaxID=350814 RepID=UPI0011E79759|nr:VanZ family protein [Aquimarina intermedia]